MSGLLLVAMMFVVMLVLMAVRIPIAAAMFFAGACGYVMQTGLAGFGHYLNAQAFARFASYDLSVIPLFILMGNFATQGGISRALFAFAAGITRRFKGGVAMAAVLASAAFGAICGSSVATAATITGVALPELRRHGYSGRLATGTLAAAGTLGILIPPSVPLVIYAILTEQNIAKLFAAAMIPGLIATLGYLVVIAIYVRIVPGQAPEVDDDIPGVSTASALSVAPILSIFLIVFGGIYGGLFTPTEGAGVGAASTLISALMRREMTWQGFKECFYATAESSGMIFLIFLGADVMSGALALSGATTHLSNFVNNLGWPPYAIVAAILVFYIVLGAVMDELSMILLTIPIFFPLVVGLDFGMPRESVAIWFGVMVLMVVEFGLLAPPVGLNVYVVNGMAKDVPIAESYRGVMPFLVSDTIRTLLLLFFPGICLWLVGILS
ncbi:MAG: TRAP transporter large permease [Betaproteobacteria bacterium]|jgi:C4-dicarboxylate transporter, DctM subunit|nr:TRAP transporter large permease [Betaproteobacteria bacterium]